MTTGLITKTLRHARVLVVLLCLQTIASAMTLQDYKSKVEAARASAIESETALWKSGDMTRTASFVRQVRADFPLTERIDWEGGTVDVSNDWILDQVGRLERETDQKKRLAEVAALREYLSTIAFKLGELDQIAAPTRSKDEDKQKLVEILRREEYQGPKKNDESWIERLVRTFLEWLEDFFPKSSKQTSGAGGMDLLAAILQILLILGFLGLLSFLIYKVAPALFPKLRRTKKTKKRDRIILGEAIGEDETASDLFGEAERLAREGNLRGAIRKAYIALLCDLSDRKVIGLARNKTNRDYLRDIRSRRDLHPRMKEVTDIFERHWYGFQDSSEEDWRRFRERYQEAMRNV